MPPDLSRSRSLINIWLHYATTWWSMTMNLQTTSSFGRGRRTKTSSSLCSLTDFIFLEEDRFLLANDGIITVFSFAGDQTLVTPQCTAKLVTPTLTQNWQFADAFLGRNPAPAIGTMTSFPRRWVERGDSSMFHLTADDQLLAFT